MRTEIEKVDGKKDQVNRRKKWMQVDLGFPIGAKFSEFQSYYESES